MSATSALVIVLDQGLPRDAAEVLRGSGIQCTHVGEIGMSGASDTEILAYAGANDGIVVTLDADFHAILVVSGMSTPSVIRVRLQGLKGIALARIIREVLAVYRAELAAGCMITVNARKTTCLSSHPRHRSNPFGVDASRSRTVRTGDR